MAFYFALLNVSAKRDDRSASTSSHRQKHRRHSIASVESPVLDYRLLPKPQVVRNEFYCDETESGTRQESGTRHESSKQSSRQRVNQNRSASSSRPPAEPSSSRSRDGRRGGKVPKERPQMKGMRKSDSNHLDTARRMKQKSENGHSNARQWKSPDRERELLEREFCAMQVASSSKRAAATAAEARQKSMNDSTESEGLRVVENLATADFDRRWRGKRPIVVKRRVSPQESSTSDSRRSSNQSNRSPQRNDSLASSTSSRHTGEAIQEVTSPVDLPSTELHKLSNSSMPSRICDLPRSVTLKKVTFENDTSQFVVDRSFLGDRRVLVRRGSGSAILPRSVTQQFAPTTPTTLRPFAEGTAALAGLAFGAALWAPLSGEPEGTPNKQNVTNDAIEQTIGHGARRSLLRRRSTSDRHVVFGFQNEGFRMINDETSDSEMTRTASGATLVPFAG